MDLPPPPPPRSNVARRTGFPEPLGFSGWPDSYPPDPFEAPLPRNPNLAKRTGDLGRYRSSGSPTLEPATPHTPSDDAYYGIWMKEPPRQSNLAKRTGKPVPRRPRSVMPPDDMAVDEKEEEEQEEEEQVESFLVPSTPHTPPEPIEYRETPVMHRLRNYTEDDYWVFAADELERRSGRPNPDTALSNINEALGDMRALAQGLMQKKDPGTGGIAASAERAFDQCYKAAPTAFDESVFSRFARGLQVITEDLQGEVREIKPTLQRIHRQADSAKDWATAVGEFLRNLNAISKEAAKIRSTRGAVLQTRVLDAQNKYKPAERWVAKLHISVY